VFFQSAEWPIDPAFSRNPKPPALAGGVFICSVSFMNVHASDDSAPRVSIGVPAYKAISPEAIESLLAQSYEDFELIIADDVSNDCTR
jgi:hypothetical protein